MKFKILIFLFIAVAVALLFLSIFLRTQEPRPVPSQSPLASPSVRVEGIDENYNRNAKQIIPGIIKSDERSNLIGALLDKFPYNGANFSLSYDYDKNLFTATVKSEDKNLGLAELDSFLLDNGIEERSWITNLVIR